MPVAAPGSSRQDSARSRQDSARVSGRGDRRRLTAAAQEIVGPSEGKRSGLTLNFAAQDDKRPGTSANRDDHANSAELL